MNGSGEQSLLREKLFEVRKCIPTSAKIDSFTVKTWDSNGERLLRKRGSLVYRFRIASFTLEDHWRALHPQGYRQITSALLEQLGARAAAWLWSENVRILGEDSGDGAAVLRRVGQQADEAEMVSEWLARITGARSQISTEKRTPRLIFDRGNRELLQTALHPVAPFYSRWLFKP
jgi:hypothetical protein